MRKLHLQLTIALRNILRQPRRSGLTILAISFSVFCVILFQALKAGMHEKMIDGALRLDLGEIQIHAAGFKVNSTRFQTLPDPISIAGPLRGMDGAAYSERIKAPALVLAGSQSASVLLSGIVPEREKNITLIHRRITTGAYVAADTEKLLVGRPLAEALQLGIGDSVSLMLQDVFGKPVVRKIAVGGIYDTGLSSFDLNHIYLPLASLQGFLDVPGEVSEIAIATRADRAEGLAELLRETLGPKKYAVTSWQAMAPDLVQLMELNDATFNLLVIIIFCIVAMGIANTMNSVIFERFREFGTIAAIGTTPAEIIAMVSFESLLLGLFACLTGTAVALLACFYLSVHGIDLTPFTSSNQYFAAGAILKASVLTRDVASANVITLAAALLAGLYPAIKASRLNPVDALNYT